MQRKLLSRDFVLLWLGLGVSQLGTGVGYIATLWWVQTTTGSAVALGTLAMVSGLVGVVLSPFAGVFVDRWNRKHIIVITDLKRGVTSCFLAWAVFTNTLTLPVLFLATALKSACAQFFMPAISAAVPQIVDDRHLEKANSLRQITQNVSNMVGYALGGLLVAVLGIPALLLANGVAFIASAISEMFMELKPLAHSSKLNVRTFLSDLAGGMAYVKRDKVLFGIMQVMVIINFAFVPFFVLLPKFVEEHLGAGSEVLGLISSSQMAGMILGALVLSMTPFVTKNQWVIRWGLAMSAGTLMLSPWVPSNLWATQLFIFGVSGAITAIVNIFFFTTLQRKVAPAYMGKVFSLVNAMAIGLQPLASAFSGVLADRYSMAMIYTAFGSLALLGNVRMLSIAGINEYFGFRKTVPAPLEAQLTD